MNSQRNIPVRFISFFYIIGNRTYLNKWNFFHGTTVKKRGSFHAFNIRMVFVFRPNNTFLISMNRFYSDRSYFFYFLQTILRFWIIFYPSICIRKFIFVLQSKFEYINKYFTIFCTTLCIFFCSYFYNFSNQ